MGTVNYKGAMAKVLASKRVRKTKRHSRKSLEQRAEIIWSLRGWEGKYLIFGERTEGLSKEAFNALLYLVGQIKDKKI